MVYNFNNYSTNIIILKSSAFSLQLDNNYWFLILNHNYFLLKYYQYRRDTFRISFILKNLYFQILRFLY